MSRTAKPYHPSQSVKELDAAFEEWLEREHPAHSAMDHENLGAYHSWMQGLYAAFKAGVEHGKRAAEHSTKTEKD